MNTDTTRRFARYFALPAISAGIIAGALGFAGAANAGTYSQDQTPQTSFVATPTVTAHPAPEALPGTHHHDRIAHVMNLEPSYHP
ncbi:MAG TPA: hypothetical protein VHI10_11845 [Mycobacterium sp.]|nr:hypothetical protein [Mycobacterium sp.]